LSEVTKCSRPGEFDRETPSSLVAVAGSPSKD